jgi:heme-degrading monooxygenase HmoA
MIIESASIVIKPGMEQQFEAGFRQAVPIFQRARGCVSLQLQREVGQALAYRLQVHWRTLEDHTIHFRGSDDFQEWRRLVGPCFDSPPVVTHLELRIAAF